jgi:hypothetical protein
VNVVFHILGALGTASVLAQTTKTASAFPKSIFDLAAPVAGFAIGIAAHGLMDAAPHGYPLRAGADVLLALLMMAAAFGLADPRRWVLLAACCAGALFPDLVDLGPAILNKHFGLSLPVVKIFPWHWPEHSGSIYDGSRAVASAVCHLIALVLGGGAIALFGRRVLRWSSN